MQWCYILKAVKVNCACFDIKCSKTFMMHCGLVIGTFAFPYQCKPVVPAWGNILHSSSLSVTILKHKHWVTVRAYNSLLYIWIVVSNVLLWNTYIMCILIYSVKSKTQQERCYKTIINVGWCDDSNALQHHIPKVLNSSLATTNNFVWSDAWWWSKLM